MSIPFTSENSFLHRIFEAVCRCLNLCQSPSHRGTHFYAGTKSSASVGLDVSIPFTSENSFLRWQSALRICQRRCVSIPFTSENSFLHHRNSYKGRTPKWCQSPSHRRTHFYRTGSGQQSRTGSGVSIPFTSENSFLRNFESTKEFTTIVSIPFTSENSFLQARGRGDQGIAGLCQSPSHRRTHFYDSDGSTFRIVKLCQSPSHRRTHFYVKAAEKEAGLCQSPSHRRTHFYGG